MKFKFNYESSGMVGGGGEGMIDPNSIILGDCLEIMKQIPDKSIDLVLTDPQYGKNADKGTHGFGNSEVRKYDDNWDSSIPDKIYFDEIFRISRNQIIFGGNYFTKYLPASNCWIVWDKKGDVKFQNPFADCELIWTSFNKVVKKYILRQQGFINDSKDKRYHPTQKPSELIIEIIKDYSNLNDLILDPFLGSGTTAVACVETGRRFIGIEISPEYCEIAKKRVAIAQAQGKLF